MVILLILIMTSTAFSSVTEPTHLDRAKNPAGCAVCHAGHGMKGTPMLRFDKKDVCFVCHGMPTTEVPDVLKANKDLYTVFRRPYKHPVMETYMYHEPSEELPERDPSRPRHVDCLDCHSIHYSTSENPLRKVEGYVRGDSAIEESPPEYKVCYKCHSDSINLPSDQENIADAFDPANPSYHPVEAVGNNSRVPSLRSPFTMVSRITCSDCHGNNDPDGPEGPHGSDYEYILRARYDTTAGPETYESYELCYNCHERQSILDNQSFQAHREHIVYQQAPCSACHNSHGSRQNQHLIDFSPAFVDPVPIPEYVPSPIGKPLCYLNCHGTDHNTEFYGQRGWQ